MLDNKSSKNADLPNKKSLENSRLLSGDDGS